MRTAGFARSVGFGEQTWEQDGSKMREISSLLIMLVSFAGMLCMLLLSGCA